MTRKPRGYWTEETIISELKLVIEGFGRFPNQQELCELGKKSLKATISRHGGSNYFRDIMGYEILCQSRGYWTEEKTTSELKTVIDELGHFPSTNDLIQISTGGLSGGIKRYGGINHFREKMGYELLQNSKGYWTEEKTTSELKTVIDELGHFPRHTDLYTIGKSNLATAITAYGGVNYFRVKCGFSLSIQEIYKSKLATYIIRRGQKSEQFVKGIITEWTEIHDVPALNYNVKLSKGNVIEFVCDLDKKIGVDVTNTKASKHSTYSTIKRKWRHKDYHLHLDELWIVVFTDVLTSNDYDKLNQICPENVKVFSIDEFLKELDYSTENYNKINLLKKCSFHNKEEIINLNRTVD